MKKIIYSFILMFALTACSLNDVISLLVTPTSPPPTPVDTSTPTVVLTPSDTPTITPIPTFTSTPTKVGGSGNSSDLPSVEAQPLPTLMLIPTATPAPQMSFFSEPGSLILSLSVSSDTLLWGYCNEPKYVDFDVRLANTIRVTYVLLFMRLVDKGGMQSTGWGGGAIMEEVGGGYYTYHVTPDKISHYNEFKDAWIEYQVVAATGSLKSLGRSPVYRNSLSLRYCLPIEVEE